MWDALGATGRIVVLDITLHSTCLKFCTVRGGPAHDDTCTCIFKPFIAGLQVYNILLYNSVFKIHSIFNIVSNCLQKCSKIYCFVLCMYGHV